MERPAHNDADSAVSPQADAPPKPNMTDPGNAEMAMERPAHNDADTAVSPQADAPPIPNTTDPGNAEMATGEPLHFPMRYHRPHAFYRGQSSKSTTPLSMVQTRL